MSWQAMAHWSSAGLGKVRKCDGAGEMGGAMQRLEGGGGGTARAIPKAQHGTAWRGLSCFALAKGLMQGLMIRKAVWIEISCADRLGSPKQPQFETELWRLACMCRRVCLCAELTGAVLRAAGRERHTQTGVGGGRAGNVHASPKAWRK